MKQKSFNIKFKAIDEYAFNVCLPPEPAKNNIPQWWKDMEVFTSKNILSDNEKDIKYRHITSKKCFPMLDAMTAGYVLKLWTDVEVKEIPGVDEPLISWQTDKPVFATWAREITTGMEYPEDAHPTAFKFLNPYIIETPPGWSCLFTHPAGYSDLPFYTVSGLVDTDNLKTDINPVLWIKKGFSGIIPKGTPIAQIIPIQRKDWQSKVELMAPNENYFNVQKYIKTTSQGAYKLLDRVKKYYN